MIPIFGDKKFAEELQDKGVQLVDRIEEQIMELYNIRNPKIRSIPDKSAEKLLLFREKYKKKGVYCFLPIRNKVFFILPEELYFELRTSRNRDLITKEEQSKFKNFKIAIAGLSVGSNIARINTLQGGSKEINIADLDILDTTNLNRIMSGLNDLGKKKTEILADYLYETDPFLKINLFSEGVLEDNIENFLKINGTPVDLVVEEVDNPMMKMLIRKECVKLKKPLISITDNGDGVIIDIERYDQGYDLKKFLKKFDKVSDLNKEFSIKEVAKKITSFIGIKDVETRMLESVLKVGDSLYSWPQLGGSAVLSGVVGAYCIRQIACGYKMKSGRYIISLPKIFSNKENKIKRNKLLKFFK